MGLKKWMAKFSWINFLLITVAGIINAFGVTVFIAPVKLYDSGISGTSLLLSQLTPEFFTLSFFLVILNIPLFILGYRRQGLTFTVYSIYAVIVYSLAAWMITDVLPIDVSMASPLAGTDLLLCALFGGLISGVGSGLTIRFGGAIDGIEVLSVIFARQLGITVGSFIMGYNVLLYILAGIVLHSWILPLYSIITYGAGLKTVDFIVEGFDREKAAIVITNQEKTVCKAISDAFGSGITIIEGKGYYSDASKTIIYFVVNRFQIGKMKSLVHENDPSAFITISEVAEVLGSGVKKENKEHIESAATKEENT